MGLDTGLALRLGRALGGGLGAGEVCGAVSGAAVILGLTQGQPGPGERELRAQVKQLNREFLRRFRERHGTIICRELLGVDPSTDTGWQAAMDQELFVTLCPRFVAAAGAVLEELLPDRPAPA